MNNLLYKTFHKRKKFRISEILKNFFSVSFFP